MRKEVKLGDICNILNGYAFKSKEYVEDGIRVIRITNVQKGNIEDNDPKYYDISKIEELKNYMLKENDLLISLTGNVGRVGLLPKKFLPAGLNQRVGCLRIKDERNVSVEYLYQYFNSYNFERDCINNSKGIAQKNLSTEWLKNYKVSIPNLNEQNRIVNELKKIQKLKKLKEQQLKELNQLIKSQFVEMFGNKKYIKKCLKDLSITKGKYGSGSPAGEYQEGKPRYIRITDINEDGKLNDNITSPKNEENIEKYILKYGDVLFARTGATVGKTYKYSEKDGYCIYAGYCIKFSINLKLINPDYIFAFTKTEEYKRWVKNKQRVVAQPNINAEEYGRELMIPVPPITLQNQFSEIVKQIDKQKFEIEKSLKETQELYESLMEKYFG